jgi:hypothetical protein
MISAPKVLAVIAAAIGAFFAARSAYLGYTFLRPVQYWDQLGSVHLYLSLNDGNFRISFLWAFHNEHRILTSRLMYLIDAVYFDLGNRFLIASIFSGLFALTLIFASLALKARTPARVATMTLALLGIGWSIAQHETLTWGFQTAFIFPHLFALACFFCFAEMLAAVSPYSRLMWFALACVADALGMLSWAGGVFIGFAAVIISLPLRARNGLIVAFIVFHIAAMAAYVIGMPRVPGSQGATVFEMAHFFLRCLGSIARAQPHAPAIVGLILLSVSILLTVRTFRKSTCCCERILRAVILFVIFATAATAAGRAGLGMEQALASRYGTQSAILAMAVLALCWRSLPTAIPRCATMIGAVVLTVLGNGDQNVREIEDDIYARDTAMFSFINGVYPLSQTSRIYADTQLVERYYERLSELRKGPFALSAAVYRPPLNSESSFDIAKLPSCRANIDAVTHHDTWSEVGGWISAPGWILGYTDSGRLVGYTISSIRRPDVQSVLSVSYDRLGFDLFLKKDRIGGDRINLIAITETQRSPCTLGIMPPAL